MIDCTTSYRQVKLIDLPCQYVLTFTCLRFICLHLPALILEKTKKRERKTLVK